MKDISKKGEQDLLCQGGNRGLQAPDTYLATLHSYLVFNPYLPTQIYRLLFLFIFPRKMLQNRAINSDFYYHAKRMAVKWQDYQDI